MFVSKILSIPFFYLWLKPKIYGKDKIKSNAPVILIHNHTSYWDPCVANTCFITKKVHFMATHKIFEYNKFVSWVLGQLGAFPVERGLGKSDAVVDKCVKMLKENTVLVIAPEGRIYNDGKIHEFRTGVARIAIESGAEVIPMYIRKRKSWWNRTHISLGERINLKEKYGDIKDYEALTKICEDLRKEMARISKRDGFDVPLA